MNNNNKLIAEFMELETETFSSGIVNYYHQDIAEGSFFEEHELSYNLSWDWLMPVVDKCFQYGELHNSYREEIIASLSGVIDIEDTYDAVVQFINQYNKNI